MTLTVSETIKFYWKEHVAVKVIDKTRLDYALREINDYMGERLISSIRLPACREYQAHRAAGGVMGSTIRRELSALKSAALHCVKWDHITETELPRIDLPPGSPPRVIWLYKDELKALAGAATGRALNFVLIAYYTAARKTNVETLERYQIDLDAQRIRLAKKGEVKTNKRRPLVPIDPALQGRLSAMLSGHTSRFVLETDADIRPEFTKAAKAAGLLELPERGLREAGRLTPHVLRHSRATHLLQDGVNPFAVANLLGDNMQTVLRVYGHACPDYLAEAMKNGFAAA